MSVIERFNALDAAGKSRVQEISKGFISAVNSTTALGEKPGATAMDRYARVFAWGVASADGDSDLAAFLWDIFGSPSKPDLSQGAHTMQTLAGVDVTAPKPYVVGESKRKRLFL